MPTKLQEIQQLAKEYENLRIKSSYPVYPHPVYLSEVEFQEKINKFNNDAEKYAIEADRMVRDMQKVFRKIAKLAEDFEAELKSYILKKH